MHFCANLIQNFLIGASRIGADLGLFRQLVSHGKPMTVAQLSEATGASENFLGG